MIQHEPLLRSLYRIQNQNQWTWQIHWVAAVGGSRKWKSTVSFVDIMEEYHRHWHCHTQISAEPTVPHTPRTPYCPCQQPHIYGWGFPWPKKSTQPKQCPRELIPPRAILSQCWMWSRLKLLLGIWDIWHHLANCPKAIESQLTTVVSSHIWLIPPIFPGLLIIISLVNKL